MQKYMTSIFAWYGYRELTPAKSFRLIKQAGFDSVLLWWSDEFDPKYRLQPELARQAGLQVENIHVPDEDANHLWEDTPKGQHVFEDHLRCLDDCAQFGIPTMVMHAFCGEPPPLSEIGIRRFARLVEHTEALGVNIAVEYMRRGSQMEQVAFLLEHFDSSRFGLCFDSGHDHARKSRTPETKIDMLDRFGHRLKALHLHDNDGTAVPSCLPFDGTIDWPAQMRKVAAMGYTGPTTLEVLNTGYESLPPEEFLALAQECAKRLEQLRI